MPQTEELQQKPYAPQTGGLPTEARPGYKKTKLGWIPEEWEFATVSTFGAVVTGNTPSTAQSEFYDGDFLFVSPADINGGKYVSSTGKTLTLEGFQTGRVVPKGSALFVSIGSTIGKVGLAGKDLITNQQINSVVPNKHNDGEFIYYQLSLQNGRIKRIAGHQAVPILNKSTFSKIEIFKPPLPEQRAIARILSTWDKAIDNLQKLIAKKQEGKKGLMQQLLSGEKRFEEFVISDSFRTTKYGKVPEDWKEVKLTQVLKKAKLGGNYANAEDNRGIPLMKMGNLGRGSFKFGKIENVPEGEAYSEDDILKEGDLLFNTRNTLDLVGKVARWKKEIPLALYNSNLLRLDFDNRVEGSNHFANYYFNSHTGLRQLRAFAIGTTSVAAIYTRDLMKFKFFLPSVEEQQKIASVLSAADREIEKLQGQLEKLQEQKKGLMQKLLTGEVRTIKRT